MSIFRRERPDAASGGAQNTRPSPRRQLTVAAEPHPTTRDLAWNALLTAEGSAAAGTATAVDTLAPESPLPVTPSAPAQQSAPAAQATDAADQLFTEDATVAQLAEPAPTSRRARRRAMSIASTFAPTAAPVAPDGAAGEATTPAAPEIPAAVVEPVEEDTRTPRERAVALAERLGLAYVDLTEFVVEPGVVNLIPDQMCRRQAVLPISRVGERLVVVVADPENVIVLDDVAAVVRMPIAPVVAEREAILAAIDRYHRVDSELEELTSAFESDSPLEKEVWTQDVADAAGDDEAPIIRFVNLIISQAVMDRASDIHIEPGREDLRVRYRIDGVLTEVQRVPRNMVAGVISRLKVMAELDIGERRKPQDGRISIMHGGRTVDLRVATLPTVWGEKVVARVLDSPVASLKLSDLGMLDRNMEVFRNSFTKPYGMMLVTGPTGSGKSTTLYTTLAAIAKPTVNVITVEDPVEYRMPGINQVQVNNRAGLTFSAALRSILRSDPDVILLGEIRDEETAKIAIEASLTGHLVLSTLHTNDAPSSVTRLIEMGVEPFLVGSALDSVVAQRLARRLCERCKTSSPATETELRIVGAPPEMLQDPPMIHRPKGCSQCSNTGYRGRIAVHEVMAVDDEVERMAVANAPTARIAEYATSQGMTRLRQDGWAKVLLGLTSVDEILRVTV
ncbi:GspE/PulE family protein [Microbacterium tenebrionis]|uniref:GspE/PulE family protein n=1 Tax=Microbacterium tenebrionis TaxID=2830665 RepID=UPI00202AE70C|nr:GspE/PulE family protein [Microbacterium ihumii]